VAGLGVADIKAELADLPVIGLRDAVLGQANTDCFPLFTPNGSNALTLDKSCG
jgi:hypothetical protein